MVVNALAGPERVTGTPEATTPEIVPVIACGDWTAEEVKSCPTWSAPASGTSRDGGEKT